MSTLDEFISSVKTLHHCERVVVVDSNSESENLGAFQKSFSNASYVKQLTPILHNPDFIAIFGIDSDSSLNDVFTSLSESFKGCSMLLLEVRSERENSPKPTRINQVAYDNEFYVKDVFSNSKSSFFLLHRFDHFNHLIPTPEALKEELQVAWKFSDSVFALLTDLAFKQQPIKLRHPFIFYLGHLPAFGHNQICNYILKKQKSFNAYFDDIFERGIDPIVDDPSTCHSHSYVPPQWPTQDEVKEFKKKARELMLDAASGEIMAQRGRVFSLVAEHDYMHAETLFYMYLNLENHFKVRPENSVVNYVLQKSTMPKGKFIEIPAGTAVLGADFHEIRYGWDNEFPKQKVEVPAFKISELPVTVGEFLEFLESGEYENPVHWTESNYKWKQSEDLHFPNVLNKNDKGEWVYRTVFDELSIEQVKDWPIFCSQAEACAFAHWKGKRLPSEAEFMRAAYGKKEDAKGVNSHPWGSENPRPGFHGNFGFFSYAPTPVGYFPNGKSEFGVHDLIGSGWEWTSSLFDGLKGFEAYIPHYQGYSKDFFDGKHYVMLGASWATASPLVRRSFRNWFQSHYKFMFSKFRLAEDV